MKSGRTWGTVSSEKKHKRKRKREETMLTGTHGAKGINDALVSFLITPQFKKRAVGVGIKKNREAPGLE